MNNSFVQNRVDICHEETLKGCRAKEKEKKKKTFMIVPKNVAFMYLLLLLVHLVMFRLSRYVAWSGGMVLNNHS